MRHPRGLMTLALGAAFSSAFARRRLAALFTASAAAFFSAAFIGFIDRGPGAFFRFFFADAALFVAAFDVAGLSLLFAGVFLFTSSCHEFPFVRFLQLNAVPVANGCPHLVSRYAR